MMQKDAETPPTRLTNVPSPTLMYQPTSNPESAQTDLLPQPPITISTSSQTHSTFTVKTTPLMPITTLKAQQHLIQPTCYSTQDALKPSDHPPSNYHLPTTTLEALTKRINELIDDPTISSVQTEIIIEHHNNYTPHNIPPPPNSLPRLMDLHQEENMEIFN